MRILLFALTLLLPLSAQAQTNDTSNPIIARMADLVAAYNAQDLEAIGAIYTEDAALFAPGERSILGRAAIVQHYADALASGARDVQFMTFDIQSTDTTAVEIGETVLQVGPTRIVTRYMHLWEVVGGQLLLSRDMYHVLSAQ
jgi:ketosteroid isomerase-like protein